MVSGLNLWLRREGFERFTGRYRGDLGFFQGFGFGKGQVGGVGFREGLGRIWESSEGVYGGFREDLTRNQCLCVREGTRSAKSRASGSSDCCRRTTSTWFLVSGLRCVS